MTTIDDYRAQLDRLAEMAQSHEPGSEEFAEWSRYLCIRTSGYFEQALVDMCERHAAANGADPNVVSFVSTSVRFNNSFDANKVGRMFGGYNKEWQRVIKRHFRDHGEEAGTLQSLLANRNLIAHGEDSGVTVAAVREWLTHIDSCIGWLRAGLESGFAE